MKKATKLPGIIALIAVIGLGITGCKNMFDAEESNRVTGVSLSEHNIELTVGQEYYLNANVQPYNTGNQYLRWDLDNDYVLGWQIINNGYTAVVYAQNPGDTNIHVTTVEGGYIDTCRVVVNKSTLDGYVYITGDAIVGQTLWADTSYLGGNGDIYYEWTRSNYYGSSYIGWDSYYTVQTDDIGYTITVTVTRSENSGSVPSWETSVVTSNDFPALNGTVSITGDAVVGQTLYVDTSDLSGSGTFYYQWKRGGYNIAGDSYNSYYTVQTADIGSTITVTVTCSGNSGSVTSTATTTVTNSGLPTLTGTVSINGTAEVGQTLTANIDNLGGSGTITYQWKRDGTNIGDNSSTYMVQTTDEGYTITVTVIRSGNSDSVTSGPTAVVIIGNGGGSVEVTVAMWDSYGDGWNGAALRINVNGANLSPNATIANGGSENRTFNVSPGDVVTFYWVSGQYDSECGFAVYYNSNPPSPAFNPNSGYWSSANDPQGRVLLYKQYNSLGSVSNGTSVGSFTVGSDNNLPGTADIFINLTDMNEWELTEQTAQATPNVNKVFTVTGSYTTYRWYLDGTQVGTSSGYTFNKPVGVYQLAVVVTNSAGESRSGSCWVTVEASLTVYTVTFNTNSGSGTPPVAQTINGGSGITLPEGSGLSRSGYTFGGWNTNTSGTGTNYNAGSSYTPTGNVTLYAKWNSSSGGGIPSWVTGTPTTLSTSVWANGSLTSTIREVWYSFTVSSGSTYYVWLDDADNTSGYVDAKIAAYYSSGNNIFDADTNSHSFTATSSGTVYVKVYPYSTGTGTYRIAYSTSNTKPGNVTIPSWVTGTPTALSANVWANSSITSTSGVDWYSFTASSATTYFWLNDKYQGNGSKNGEMEYTVYNSSGTAILTQGYGYETPKNASTTIGDKYYIKVAVYSTSSANIGTYGLVYSTGTTRPAL